MSFGINLKNIRIERNMSQDALANMLHTTKQVISRYENGQRVPKIDTVIHYCKILNVPITQFMSEEDIINHLKDDLYSQKEKMLNANEEEVTLINNYRKLNAKDKTVIQAYIKSMISDDDEKVPLVARSYDICNLISIQSDVFSKAIKNVKFVESDDNL